MTLPSLDIQSLYLDLGWGMVCAAIVLWLLDVARWPLPPQRRRTTYALVTVACIACMWLPGPLTPTFWLGMAFQHPSLMLVLLSAAQIGRTIAGGRIAAELAVLTPTVAATLAVLGFVLYAGTFVWFPYDVYALGYARFAAAAIATMLTLAWCVGDTRSGVACIAAGLAALLHATTRLPTGNAWDAILDPLLFCVAAVIALRALAVRLRDGVSMQPARAIR